MSQSSNVQTPTTSPSPEEATTPRVIILAGKDEMNLAEFPIARLGRNDTRLTIEYHGQIIDKTGGVLEQTWIVSGSAKFGLPTEFAERVLVGLMTLTAREQFTERKVPFTIYRVLKLLDLTHNKRNYQAVEKALNQLVGITIYSEGAFWDKAKQKRVTSKKGFHLIEEFWLKSSEGDDAVIEAEGVNGYIIWGERLWESFKSGYIKHLDTNFYYSLDNTIARRLYRFLDKRMHYQDSYQIDIFDLAARLGMKPYPYPSDVARKLQPALEELQEKKYLLHADVIKVGKYTRIKFVRSGALRALQTSLWDVANNNADMAYATPGTIKTVSEENSSSESGSTQLAALYVFYNTSDSLKQVWTDILHEYASTMPSESYRMIADCALVDLEGTEAVIAVNERTKDWVERQMRRKFLLGLRSHLGIRVTDIVFVVLS
jgi:hypothetical protein